MFRELSRKKLILKNSIFPTKKKKQKKKTNKKNRIDIFLPFINLMVYLRDHERSIYLFKRSRVTIGKRKKGLRKSQFGAKVICKLKLF